MRGTVVEELPVTFDSNRIHHLAQALWRAEQTRKPIAALSMQYPDLSEADAYRISAARLQLRNRRTTGYKLGYTSEAMRRQMNISTPNYGVLTDDLLVCGGELPHDALIHPLVEPEIAIRLHEDLALASDHDKNSVMAARPEFMLAIEVCDTRYLTYKFAAVDNIADNSSASRYVLGTPSPISLHTDLESLSVELRIDGKTKDQGVGANALGNPLLAVAWLGNRLSLENTTLKAGDVILTGGLTRGYRVQRGQTVTVTSKASETAGVSVQFT